ncbi:hypothetical protein N6O11_21820 [Escherichia coli]|uniref:hypothetical protein n=1 Tax=Escherichia coli TaxID=562 RepID=UPI00234C7F23|nr:hypothetical protein [Escherichia coli]MDC7102434.1 hypothetical protein [Escherichia coli]
MDNINKHGLSRRIPETIKRQIRQRCGFGCVICGFGFYDYEHFKPDFVDAKVHDPNGMTLLCSQCNQKRARGRLSAQTVEIADRNPKCLQAGFANEMFDFHNEPITVKFAGVTFHNCQNLIVVNEQPILSVTPSPIPHGPMLLSGIFCNSIGKETLLIDENEWKAKSDNWDVECTGPRITIRRGPGEFALVLKMEPPTGLIVERLDMLYEGVRMKGDKDLLEVSINGGPLHRWQSCSMSNCHTGLAIQGGIRAANDPLYCA